MLYSVVMRGTCEIVVQVEADSPSDAKRRVANGESYDLGEVEPLNDWRVARQPAWTETQHD